MKIWRPFAEARTGFHACLAPVILVSMRNLRALTLVVGAVAILSAAAPGAQPVVRILFMHHSTGANLVRDGGVREGLTALGYEFWDHGYNDEGLSDGDGLATGRTFGVPDDNTSPDGWAAVFAQEPTSPPANAFSYMLEFDVIAIKSCFPASNITDDEMLANYEAWYLAIRARIDLHPDKLFILFTPPPLVPNETEPGNAARAQRWAAWLSSDSYAGGRRNLAVFDFFHLLSDDQGFLRREYRLDAWDSHPNEPANRSIGPLLVDFLDAAIRRWEAAP